MNLIEIAQQPLINRTELAKLMYPGKPDSLELLNNKIANRSGQRFTKFDQQLLNNVLQDFLDNLMMSRIRNDDLNELLGR